MYSVKLYSFLIIDTDHLVADLHVSARNLTKCMSLDSSGGESLVRVHIHLTVPKQRTFPVYLSGIDLNCNPIGGIAMLIISNNGDLIRCKALVSSHEEGIVTCPYECKCPDICSVVVAYIDDKVTLSLCKIGGWYISTIEPLLILHENVDFTPLRNCTLTIPNVIG